MRATCAPHASGTSWSSREASTWQAATTGAGSLNLTVPGHWQHLRAAMVLPERTVAIANRYIFTLATLLPGACQLEGARSQSQRSSTRSFSLPIRPLAVMIIQDDLFDAFHDPPFWYCTALMRRRTDHPRISGRGGSLVVEPMAAFQSPTSCVIISGGSTSRWLMARP